MGAPGHACLCGRGWCSGHAGQIGRVSAVPAGTGTAVDLSGSGDPSFRGGSARHRIGGSAAPRRSFEEPGSAMALVAEREIEQRADHPRLGGDIPFHPGVPRDGRLPAIDAGELQWQVNGFGVLFRHVGKVAQPRTDSAAIVSGTDQTASVRVSAASAAVRAWTAIALHIRCSASLICRAIAGSIPGSAEIARSIAWAHCAAVCIVTGRVR